MPSFHICPVCQQRKIRTDRKMCIYCRMGALESRREALIDFGRTHLVTGDCLVASDLHIPLHDSAWLARICETAEDEEIKQLVIGGDALDFMEISRFPRNSPEDDVSRSLEVTAETLRQLIEVFPAGIWIIRGNHELRLQKIAHDDWVARTANQHMLATLRNDPTEKLSFRDQYQFYMDQWMIRTVPEAVGVVHWLVEPFCELEGPEGGKPWYLVHQKNGSINPPTEAKKHWAIRGAQPVITTHSHLPGLRTSDDGVTPLVNLGCVTDQRSHEYANREPNGYSAWARAFAVMRKGRMTLYVDSPYLGAIAA